MIIKNKLILAVILFCMILLLLVSTVFSEETINVTGIDLTHKELILAIGEEEKIEAIIYPENATDREVLWFNNNSEVINIEVIENLANVISLSPGEAIVTAISSDGNFRADCFVTVIIPVRSIGIEPQEIILAPGESIYLKAWVEPSNATEQGIIWDSSDQGVATIDSGGNVIAKKIGETRIIARSEENERIFTYSKIIVSTEMATVADDGEPALIVPVEELPPADESSLLIYFVLGSIAIVVLIAILYVIFHIRKQGDRANQLTRYSYHGEQEHRPVLIGRSGNFAGQKFNFESNKITIGRDPSVAQVLYSEDNGEISRKHCSVYFDPVSRQFILEDTSSNGTFIASGEKLQYNHKHYLQPGETFSLLEAEEIFSVELE